MKSNRTGLIAVSLALGLLTLGAARLDAQTAVFEKVSVTATMYVQGATNDNNTTTTIKTPTKSTVSTANLLKQLCQDEFAEGSGTLTSGSVPSGAALVYNGTGFEIDKGTNQIVDVSDILTIAVSGQNDINAGNFLDANGQGTAPFTQTDYQIYTLTYNDTSSTGALAFTVTGLGTATEKATSPNSKTGNFTQSGSFSLQSGTGEGVGKSGPFVLSGFTITASGSTAENSGTGTNEQ